MFKKILFPIDFSENVNRVVPYVHSLSEKYHALIDVVYVARELTKYGEIHAPGDAVVAYMSGIQEQAETLMEDYISQHFKGMPSASGQVLLGDPVEEIINYAKNNEIDLIIMGTHGRKGLDRVILGSVAENVTRSSHVPVMTVNPYLVKRAQAPS
ncbi:MAG: universal stress protein [Pseudomonadota bacterium]